MMQHAPDVFVPARPARHARLFELIRQENLSRTLGAIVQRRPEQPRGVSDPNDFLTSALASFAPISDAA